MLGGRMPTRLAWSLVAVIATLVVGAIVLLALGVGTPLPLASFGFKGWGVLLASALGVAGFLVASRVPANRIGWLLLLAGVGAAVQEFAQQYAYYGLLTSPGSLPAADVAAWITEWIWIPFMAILALHIPLLYPDGHLPSPRWRPVLAIGTVGAALGTILFALEPGDLPSMPGVANPVGLDPDATWVVPAANLSMVAYTLTIVIAIGSLVIRFRRVQDDERQQLKWLMLALSVLAFCFLVGVPYWTLGNEGNVVGFENVLENVLVLALVAIPVAIGIAILRYRLYDVDIVIKKTVVYAVLATLMFAIGAAVAWVAGGLVFTASGQSEYSWLLAGLVVGAAIWPLRRLATRVADRVVYGRRATPYEVLSEFSGRVAGTYAADDVLGRMAQVLGEAVGADAATVWLGAGQRARPVATWPADALAGPLPGTAVEVRHQGVVLGAFSVRMPARDPMTPAKERLIRDLAGQAGLVLRNAALIDDLRASRQRLVAAQDHERRRLERDIHDGAQQQLVALAVKLGLAERILATDPERAATIIGEAKTETTDTLETLRDLARGIYPPLLADEGLVSALTAQSRKAPLPVAVESDGVGRFPEEIEAAVYFSCLEALQNVAKHAEAGSVSIRLAQTDGTLTFEIVDDGHGFDPTAASHGSGLQGIADRLAALGGELTVRSALGGGTTVAGTLPVSTQRTPTTEAP